MYILYIVFQLKSHAYLYASTPQQIIDEESHPGVLADFMNSSSDSSSSSSDDSDDTTASWTTAKRIKKAMKYRRRRKSSTSSKGTASQSIHKKAVSEMPPVVHGENPGSAGASIATPDENGSSAIDFGDDGRYDADDDKNPGEPRSRDFCQVPSEPLSKVDRKNKKRERKQQKMEEKAGRKEARSTPARVPQRPALKPHVSESYLGRGDSHPEDADDLPKQRSPFRANIPALLTNTVFSSQNPPPSQPQPVVGLRRTNSMPVRMNRAPLVGNAVQYALSADAAGSPPEQPSPDKEPDMSRTAAIVLLLISTALVAVCAEFLVDAIPAMLESSTVSEAFIGLIILPIIGNAAEHVTAVSHTVLRGHYICLLAAGRRRR